MINQDLGYPSNVIGCDNQYSYTCYVIVTSEHTRSFAFSPVENLTRAPLATDFCPPRSGLRQVGFMVSSVKRGRRSGGSRRLIPLLPLRGCATCENRRGRSLSRQAFPGPAALAASSCGFEQFNPVQVDPLKKLSLGARFNRIFDYIAQQFFRFSRFIPCLQPHVLRSVIRRVKQIPEPIGRVQWHTFPTQKLRDERESELRADGRSAQGVLISA